MTIPRGVHEEDEPMDKGHERLSFLKAPEQWSSQRWGRRCRTLIKGLAISWGLGRGGVDLGTLSASTFSTGSHLTSLEDP